LIEAYAEKKMWKRVEGVFGKLHFLNFPLNGKAQNAPIYACEKNGRYERAMVEFH
jgi:hypothetical protein